MASRTHHFVVLGLISGFGTFGAAQTPPGVPADLRPSILAGRAGCSLVEQPGEPVAVVGLTESVSPANAPVPQNDSERLLFGQAYDTLVRAGCDSSVQPALASTWELDTSG